MDTNTFTHATRTTKQRYRCERDDGTAAHLAVDLEQAVDLKPSAEFFTKFGKVRCFCGGELVMVGVAPIAGDVVLMRAAKLWKGATL